MSTRRLIENTKRFWAFEARGNAKSLFLVLLAFTLTSSALGCANYYFSSAPEEEESRYRRSASAFDLQRSLDADLKQRGLEMEERLRGGSGFTNRNDYAVALMFVGRNEEAIRLLEALEKEKPGVYSTAGNLGTAYELAGENTAALAWIQEGIRRNPNSHQGTEWVHVKILEAKIQQEKDIRYFQTHSVLNLDATKIKENSPLMTVAGKELSSEQVADAIHYQLQERLQFVKEADPAVASLLFDYALIEGAIGTIENARALLGMAVRFGYPKIKVVPVFQQFTNSLRIQTAKKMGMYVGIGFGLGAFVLLALKNRWLTLERRQS